METVRLLEEIRSRSPVALLVIEHDMGFVEALDCGVSVMMMGRMVTSGTFAEIRLNDEVVPPIWVRSVADGGEGLRISGLVAGYEGGVVLEHVDFAVGAGQSVALLGRNGVGKTTLLKTIMGLVRPKSGSITFGGQRIDGRRPFEIARRGIGYVPQGREIFVDLTVEENLLLGNLKVADAGEIYDVFPALASKRQLQGGRLSGGQQQQLAIGRALMGGRASCCSTSLRRASSRPSSPRSRRDYRGDRPRPRHEPHPGRAEHRHGARPLRAGRLHGGGPDRRHVERRGASR